jgi:flagellar protein FliO/FliZ
VNPRALFLSCLCAVSTGSSAADAAAPVSFAPGLLQATFGLALVLALIWGAAWLTKRISPRGSSSRSPIKLLATLALGQRERVVLIELGDNWMLLGVAAGQVSALHTGPKSTLPQMATPADAPFAKLLAMARNAGKKTE